MALWSPRRVPGAPPVKPSRPWTTGDVFVEVDGEPIRTVEPICMDLHPKTHAGQPTPIACRYRHFRARSAPLSDRGPASDLEELQDPGLEVSKAWLPVETQVISREIAQASASPTSRAFTSHEVYPDTSRRESRPASAGDFILAVDEEKLTASDPEHEKSWPRLIRQYDIGAKVELNLLARDRTGQRSRRAGALAETSARDEEIPQRGL